MKGSAGKIQITTFDDLFQGDGAVSESGEKVQEIALSELFPFKNHPFQVRDDEDMRKTVESIALYGVLVPGIARPRAVGGCELIAGHRRKRGSELAGNIHMLATKLYTPISKERTERNGTETNYKKRAYRGKKSACL